MTDSVVVDSTPAPMPKSVAPSKVQVFVPYRAGLPPLKAYFSNVFSKRELIRELSRTQAKAEHQDTWFGRVWNILNPLLLGAVYFMLVLILARGATVEFYLPYLLSGLFIFSMMSTALQAGSRSMVNNKALVTKTSLPRLVIPLSNVRVSITRFLPTIFVLLVISLASGVRPHLAWVVMPAFFVILVGFMTGLTLVFATVQVYFRDTANFLGYGIRLWMYSSPILWTVAQTPKQLQSIEYLNPMYAIVGGWTEAFVYGNWPPVSFWITATIWMFVSLIGGTYMFLSRERDFAVRI